MALFTAAHAAKKIAKTANFEARYYELLAKAKDYSFRPNTDLLRIVRSFDRLVKNVSKHGDNLQNLLSDGYFDATLTEYKNQCKRETAEDTIRYIETQRNSAIRDLTALNKDMTEIMQYFDNLYRDMVIPMQAFEKMIEVYFGKSVKFMGKKLIQGTFGENHKGTALHEYQRADLIGKAKSAYKVIQSEPETSEKYINASTKLFNAVQALKQIGYDTDLSHSVDMYGKLNVTVKLSQRLVETAGV